MMAHDRFAVKSHLFFSDNGVLRRVQHPPWGRRGWQQKPRAPLDGTQTSADACYPTITLQRYPTTTRSSALSESASFLFFADSWKPEQPDGHATHAMLI
jgi:hypothetical protein